MCNYFNEDWFYEQFSKSECDVWFVGRDIMVSVETELTAEEQSLLQTRETSVELNLTISMPNCYPCVFFSELSEEANDRLHDELDQVALRAFKSVLFEKEQCGLVSKWLEENDHDNPAYRPLTEGERETVEKYLQENSAFYGKYHKSAQDVMWTIESIVKKLAQKLDKAESVDIYTHTLMSSMIDLKQQITNTGLPTIPDVDMYYDIRLNDEEVAVELVHIKLDYTLNRAFGLKTHDGEHNYAIIPYRKTIYSVKFPLLSVAAYSKMHSIEQVTVRQWIRRGKLRTAIRNGRDWLIPITTAPPDRGFSPAKYNIVGHIPEEAIEKYPFLGNVSKYDSIRIDRVLTKKYVVQKLSGLNMKLLAYLTQTERESFENYLIEAEWAKIDLNEKHLRMPLTAAEEKEKLVDAETIREEEDNLIHSIISLSKDGILHWECTGYNPISAMSGEDFDEDTIKFNPYVAQMYSLECEYQGNSFELEISETINLNDKKGTMGFDLYVENDHAAKQKIEMNICYDKRYEDLSADQLLTEYKEHLSVMMADAVIRYVEGSDAAEDAFTWARFINETNFPKSARRNPISKLAELLLKQHRIDDFHKCVLDLEFRNQLIQNELSAKDNT